MAAESIRQRKPGQTSSLELNAQAGGITIQTQPAAALRCWSRSVASSGILLAVFYVLAVLLAVQSVYYTPRPLPQNAPAHLFSEDRAREHVRQLSEVIGHRTIGSQGVGEARRYLEEQASQLLRAAANREDLEAEVLTEQLSGAVAMHFFHAPITNAYQNLSNVMLRIQPARWQARVNDTLLLNAHYDSPVGSVGAADCASCVATLLELARVVIANPDVCLSGPVIFLLNGGEETFMQASHGFKAHSAWAGNVGAFINLEATGSSGPDLLFQHTGAWTTRAYASAVKHPRGSVFVQDLFEMGLVPSDTDFRMFSYAQLGRWPGIDTALLLDSATYHTSRDTLARLQRGCVQAMGENTQQLMVAFSRHLAAQHGRTPAQQQATYAARKSVFFDVLGLVLITYPMWLGALLHSLPLLLVAVSMVPDAWEQAFGTRLQRPSLGLTSNGIKPAAAAETLLQKLWPGYLGALNATGKGAGLSALAFAGAALLPALLGLLRAVISGRSMTWFGHHSLAYAMYVPAALVGIALPYLAAPHASRDAWPMNGSPSARVQQQVAAHSALASQVLGHALLMALLAAGMTALHAGGAYLFAAWSLCSLLSSLLLRKVHPSEQGLWGCVAATVPATMLSLPLSVTLTIHCLGKASMAGHAPFFFAPLLLDTISGIIIGAFLFLNLASIAPVALAAFRPAARPALATLAAAALTAALVASLLPRGYTDEMPKRVVVNHSHHQHGNGPVAESRLVVASVDCVRIQEALDLSSLTPAPEIGTEWQAYHPLDQIMQSRFFEAPPPDLDLTKGRLSLEVVDRQTSPVDPGLERLSLELRLPHSGWGVMNVTAAGLKGWSFTEQPLGDTFSKVNPDLVQHIVRLGCNPGHELWRFWLDVGSKDPHVKIDAAILIVEPSKPVQQFVDALPSWTSSAHGTSYHSSWML